MDTSMTMPERAIPLYGLIPTTLLLLVPLIIALVRIRSTPGRFVIGAVWLRLVMDAYAPYTTPKIAAGLSINAVVSILVVVVGLTMVGLRYLRLVWMVPIYALVAIIALSAFVNHVPMEMVEQMTKFAYLVLIILGTMRGAQDVTPPRMAGALMAAYLPPLFFLVTSIALGITKQGESDGSVSYVGGYTHESVFSIALAYWGDLQIELIRPENKSPSIYDGCAGAGLHHVCILTGDLARARQIALGAGATLLVEAKVGADGGVIYVDSGSGPGGIVEILKPASGSGDLFAMIKSASRDWDGSEPVRKLG